MAEVTVKTTVNAPVERVFKSWNDEFADIYKFNLINQENDNEKT